MNRSGRIVGGVLVTIAVLWLLRLANALPFNNRTVNQFAANTPADRPPITDPNAAGAGSEPLTTPPSPPPGTQPLDPNQPGATTPGTDDTRQPSDTSGTTRPNNRPGTAVRAGW